MTAAETTGPAHDPLPTSSIPQTRFLPFFHKFFSYLKDGSFIFKRSYHHLPFWESSRSSARYARAETVSFPERFINLTPSVALPSFGTCLSGSLITLPSFETIRRSFFILPSIILVAETLPVLAVTL